MAQFSLEARNSEFFKGNHYKSVMVGNLNTWRSHWCWCHSLKNNLARSMVHLKCATSLQLGQGSRISVWFLDLNIRICDSDTVQEWRKKYRSKNLRNTCHLKCSKLKLQTGGASCKLVAHFKSLIQGSQSILSEWHQHQWFRQVFRFPTIIDF